MPFLSFSFSLDKDLTRVPVVLLHVPFLLNRQYSFVNNSKRKWRCTYNLEITVNEIREKIECSVSFIQY